MERFSKFVGADKRGKERVVAWARIVAGGCGVGFEGWALGAFCWGLLLFGLGCGNC